MSQSNIEKSTGSPLMDAFCELGVWLFAKVSDHVADGECDEWCDEVMKQAVKLGLARREEWNLAQHSHIDGDPGDLVWSWDHLPEGWRDGKPIWEFTTEDRKRIESDASKRGVLVIHDRRQFGNPEGTVVSIPVSDIKEAAAKLVAECLAIKPRHSGSSQ